MRSVRPAFLSCHDKDSMKRFILAIARHLLRRKRTIQQEGEFLGYEAFSQSTAAAIKKAASMSSSAKVRQQKRL
jgi:hypothetical protein